MAKRSEPVAILGLGAMGRGMAMSALRSGLRVIVWNRTTEAAGELAQLGAEVVDTPTEAARRSTIAVTMVTDTEAVVSIARDQGFLEALAPEAIWVQMSTIGAEGIDSIAAMVRQERPDIVLLDAPVSGSKDPAARGELTIFASGPTEARARVAPLFDALGQRTLWVGPVGAGSRMKLVNNTWLAFGAEAVAAAVAVAKSMGLGTDLVGDALRGSSISSPWQEAKLERIARDDFSAQFALSLALKDVYLALDATSPSLGALRCLADEWQRAVDAGLGHLDVTAVVQALEGD